jgi:NADH dehydrogenase [ubiquinone] 1 alpha subcomplex assembly factor 7
VTRLAERLAARIDAGGPMTVAEYMAACLGDPADGYYATREPFGRGGDFVTAPEISQIFGELVGLWAVATWQAMGAPQEFVLAELGPGRGTLMADALRAARVRPAFLDAARLHLVETSLRLRELQAAALARSGASAVWRDRIENIPPGPLILIANEFFDALPIRQFIKTGEGWAERMVGLDDAGRLAFGLRPIIGEDAAPHLSRRGDERFPPREGDTVEVSPASTAIMSAIGERIARDGGAALVIDYGYEGPAFGDTLQAVRNHRYDDPLAAPGEADLTAHVDFGGLQQAAVEAGAVARPLASQGAFLTAMGLSERVATLTGGKDEATQAEITGAAERLAAPSGMGKLFKVLVIAAPGLVVPPFG